MHQEHTCACLAPNDGVLVAFVVILDDLDDETFDRLAELAALFAEERR